MLALSPPMLPCISHVANSSRLDTCYRLSVRGFLNEARLNRAKTNLKSVNSSIKAPRSTDSALLQVADQRGRRYEDTFQTLAHYKQESNPLRKDNSSIRESNRLFKLVVGAVVWAVTAFLSSWELFLKHLSFGQCALASAACVIALGVAVWQFIDIKRQLHDMKQQQLQQQPQ